MQSAILSQRNKQELKNGLQESKFRRFSFSFFFSFFFEGSRFFYFWRWLCRSRQQNQTAVSEQTYFVVKAGAAYLRYRGATSATVHLIRRLITSGEIPMTKVGKAYVVSREALDAWLERSAKRRRA